MKKKINKNINRPQKRTLLLLWKYTVAVDHTIANAHVWTSTVS